MNGEIITSHHHSLSEAEAWIDDRIDESFYISAVLEASFRFEHDRELKSFEVMFDDQQLTAYQATYDHDDC